MPSPPPTAGPRQKTGLARAALMGSGAAALSRGLRAVIGIGTISLLSRFLGPAEFGLFALIFFLINFIQVFADFGLRVALVQRKDVSDIELNSVFWASVALGVAAALLVFALANPIASLFDEPKLAPYVQAIAPLFLLIAAQGVPNSILERQFRFQRLATAELAAGIAGAGIAVGLAAAGASVFALLAQQYVITFVIFAIYFASAKWRPRLAFSWEALKPLIGYGSYVTLAGAVGIISGYADRPIVGKKLSAADLGYLTLAQQILISPQRTITQAIRRTTFPIMSSIQSEPERVASGYLTTLHATFLVMAPVTFGIWALATPIVRLLLGDGWSMVAQVLGVLSVVALISTISELNAAIYSAHGKARFQFRWSLFCAVINIGFLWVAASHGLMAAVWAKAAAVCIQIPLNCWFLSRLLGLRYARIPASVWRPALAAALMGVAVASLDGWLALQGLNSIARLLAGVPAGVLVYVGLIALLDRRDSLALLQKVRRR